MSRAALAEALSARLPGAVATDVPVRGLTTYRLGGPLAVCVRVTDEASLAEVAAVLGMVGVVGTEDAPVLVLGRGSNVLVADQGFDGVGIVLAGSFDEVAFDVASDGSRAAARAGAAVALPVLARRSAATGLTGLEFYVGIPGSVGGAVRMNAGGHGRETADVLVRAWVLDLREGAAAQSRPRSPSQLDFGYRHSGIGPTEVVTRAEFETGRDAPEACDARIEAIVRWRREHQPGGANAGSVFKNPTGDSAGRIIDAAGLKGFRVGGATVSPKHANFFVADPDATAADVRRLVAEVQRRVEDETGVRLVPELQLVGFDVEAIP